MVQLLFELVPERTKDHYIKGGAGGNPKIRKEAWGFFIEKPSNTFRGKRNNTLKFTGVMRTNGFSCTFGFASPSRQRSSGHGGQKKRRKTGEQKKALVREAYITNISLPEKEEAIRNRKQVIGIDPGEQDIMHCVSNETDAAGKRLHCRFTAEEQKYVLQTKGRTACSRKERRRLMSNGLSACAHEGVYYLSLRTDAVNSSSLGLVNYRTFLALKHGRLLTPEYTSFYRRTIFRRQAFIGYQAKKRSEAAMVDKFRRTFGSPENCVLVYGDWGCKNQHLRHHRPTLKKAGIFRILNGGGYTVYLANEYNTSKACYDCGVQNGECKRFLMVRNPRLRYKSEAWRASGTRPGKVLCWGLTKCNRCKKRWNRDANAALNIMQIGINAITDAGRPVWLNR